MSNITHELLKELEDVKIKFNDIINHNKNCGLNYELYEDIESSFPEDVWEYVIITSDGNEYIINNTSTEFYNFNLTTIIYVYKHIHSSKYPDWDTVNGYYNDWNLFKKTLKTFNPKQIIGNFVD